MSEQVPSVLGDLAIRRLPMGGLAPVQQAEVHGLLWAAFADVDPMTEADWERALAGEQFIAERSGQIVGYASAAERVLRIDGRPLRTGYVEGVAILPGWQRRGVGTRLMDIVGDFIDEHHELGALGTGVNAFYERLGWRTWLGELSVRTSAGLRRTPDEDGYIMVLPTRSSPKLDFSAPIDCDERFGQGW